MLTVTHPVRRTWTAALLLISGSLCAAALAQQAESAGGAQPADAQTDRTATISMVVPSMIDHTDDIQKRFLENPVEEIVTYRPLRKDNVGLPELRRVVVDLAADSEASDEGGNVERTLGVSWQGQGSSTVFPPDNTMAVGPTQVVTATNSVLRFWSKSGTQEFTSSWGSFFSGIQPGGTFTSDPKVMYDHGSSRWFVMILALNNSTLYSYYLIAVSDDSNPNGTWKKYSIDSTLNGGAASSNWSDYPGFGFSSEAVYITANMFSRTTGGFQYVKVRVIPKQQMLDFASSLTWSDIWSISDPAGGTAFTIQPAWHWGTPQAPFLASSNDSANRVTVYGVNDPLGSPTLTKIALTPSSGFSVPPNAEQLGSSTLLDTIDVRVFNAVWRNNYLYFAHNRSASSQASCRWYQVNTSSWPASAALTDFGNIANSATNMWFPSVAVNSADVLAIGYSRSSTTEYASIYYSYRNPGDPAGTTSTPTLIKAGATHYTGEGGSDVRWGDYTGTVVDPTDDLTFWHYNQFPNPSNPGGWQTWVQQFTEGGGTQCPNFTQDPSSQAVCSGGSVTFTVAATGNPAPTYQWRKNGVDIGGATSTSYTINPVGTGDAGSYDCVATNSCGTDTSAAATLTVNVAPSITVQPQPQTVCSGGSATFTVTATGTPAPTYQWRKNGVNIGGATSSSYTINPVGTGDAAAYSCVVTNSCGSVTSEAAILTVNVAPSISVHPSPQAACPGGSATFNVTASGTPAPTYQWRKGGVDIGGATGSSYTINPVAPGDAGSYDVIVTNSCGSATSNAATLTINEAPSVTVDPVSQSVCSGGSVMFSVSATGTPALTYQWRKGGVNIGGATSSSYTINPASPGDAGSYDCVVTNACGSDTSAAATLTVDTAPAISEPPVPATACVGDSAVFTVTASGTPTLTYQWRKNGADLAGETNDFLLIDPVGLGDAGNYSVRVSNGCGSTTSVDAALTVNTGPSISVQPASQNTCEGDSVSFSVTASGTGTLTYQWRKDGSDILGETNSSYTINPVAAGDAGDYDVVVTDDCGSVTSDAATLTVGGGGVTIDQQPENVAVCQGQPASFTVVASGGSLTYQWRKNTVNIGGATSATYSIPSTTTGDAGSYDCVVTSDCGSLTSDAATLTVYGVPRTCPGDVNGNNSVGNEDLQAILDGWAANAGDPDYDPAADFDCDGTIGNADLQAVLDNWADTCP
jgi:hypothetical protein